MNDLNDLIGEDVTGEEREKLERTHELLLEAGPPPELPLGLEHGYIPAELELKRMKKRSQPRNIALIAAVVIALGIAFTVGVAAGNHKSATAQPVQSLVLKGTRAAPRARANLDVLPNVSGNWPMTLSVRGLPRVAAPEYYVVWLVRNGKPFAPCGEFVVSKPGSLTLQLNAPYSLEKGDTWIVMRQKYGQHSTRTTVLEPRRV